MRSERINRLYRRKCGRWEERKVGRWWFRLKEKSFLPFSQGQLSRSAWTALERTWAEACWSDMGLGSGAHRSQVDGHFCFLLTISWCLWSSETVLPYATLWLLDLCVWLLNLRQRSEAWSWAWGLAAGAVCQCWTLGVHAPALSSSVWTLSLPPAHVTLWIPIGCGTLHTVAEPYLPMRRDFLQI